MNYSIILAGIVLVYCLSTLPGVKGWLGELMTRTALLFLPGRDYVILNDIYIPAYDGLYTQIDHIVVAKCGIIVIETKNYSGRLGGSSRKKFWFSERGGRISRVYNPIRQNSYHIKMLKDNCRGISNIKIHSIICLHPFTKVDIKTGIKIVSPLSIGSTISKLNEKVILDKEEIINTSEKIKKVMISKKKAAGEHRDLLIERTKRLKSGRCPRCTSKLLYKRGVRGRYRICSNFPICKFRTTSFQ